MERKIGEIFKYNGEWYQCVKKERGCDECAFYRKECGSNNVKGACKYDYRTDNTNVIFKKLEKVGEPFTCNYYGDSRLLLMQKYRIYHWPAILPSDTHAYTDGRCERTVAIEIKQNQEDMEEKKLNLKAFDLKAARNGKSVCTRDGRKTRIVCFDVKGSDTPIIALVANGEGNENTFLFYEDGRIYNDRDSVFDLMMFPEKHEGWINIYKERCHDTKEEAISCRACNMECIDTIKVEWEE